MRRKRGPGRPPRRVLLGDLFTPSGRRRVVVRRPPQRHATEGRRLRDRRARAPQRPSLQRRPLRDDQIGVDGAQRSSPEVVVHHAPDQGLSRAPADEDHVVDLTRPDASHAKGLLADVERAGHHGPRERFEGDARHREVEIERRPAGRHHQFLDAEHDLGLGRELALAPLRRGTETLERLRVVPRVEPERLRELVGHPLGDQQVDVVAAEERVARRRHHFEHVARQVEHRHVEGPASEVVHHDALLRPLPESVGQRGGGRLVQDPEHVDPGDLAGRLRRVPLQLGEVRRHRHDRPPAIHPEGSLGGAPHLSQHERADLRQRVGLRTGLHQHAAVGGLHEAEGKPGLRPLDLHAVEGSPDQPLDRVDGVHAIDEAPLARRIADDHVPARMERDDRRDQSVPLLVREDPDRPLLRHRDDRVRGAQVDAEHRVRHAVHQGLL